MEGRAPKIHSIRHNFIMNAIQVASTFLFPLITFPYVSRVLGAAGTGRVAFAVSVVYYFTAVASLGIPTYGLRACARCREDPEQLRQTVQELLLLGCVLTALCYAALLILIHIVPRFEQDRTLLLVCSGTLLLTNIGAEWFYQAIEQYDYITLRNIAFKLLSLVLMFLLVKTPDDCAVYAGVQVLATVGANVLNFLRLNRFVSLRPVGHWDIRRHLRPTLVFFLLAVATTIYTNLDTVMLGFMTDDTMLGYYNAAVKIKGILVSVVTALGVVLLPRLSFYLESGRETEFRRIARSAMQVVLVMAVPLTLYCMLEAENIIRLLSGREYLPAVPAMIAIMPTLLLIGLSNVTGIQILVPLGKERLTVRSTVWGAATDLVLNLILIPRLGALGAAIGTLAAETVVLAVQLYYLREERTLRPDAADTLKILLSAAVGAAVILLGRAVLGPVQSSFLALLLSAVGFFGACAAVLLVTKEQAVREFVLPTLKRFLPKASS